VDDNFIGNVHRVKTDVLPAIIAWQAAHRSPFVFNAQLSLNLADDPAMMALLTRAGFSTAFIGIESPMTRAWRSAIRFPTRGVT
jgi:hypothetical protein